MALDRQLKSSSRAADSRSERDTGSAGRRSEASPFSAGHIMQLQRAVGNQAVQTMLSAQMKKADAPIQRFGLEEEEELQMKRSDAPIQRFGLEEEEELQMKRSDAPIQRFGLEEEEELQMKKADAPIQRKTNGKMPEAIQSKMESAIGADFSDVNIHVGSKASDVGALAYTQGSDIHFAPGQYNPDTSSGQQLLGHELTHVKQQREGRVQPTTQAKGLPVNDDPGLEREADQMGAKAARS